MQNQVNTCMRVEHYIAIILIHLLYIISFGFNLPNILVTFFVYVKPGMLFLIVRG